MPDQPPTDDRTAPEPDEPLGRDELARLAAIHRSLEPADLAFESPPPVVWDRITEALDASEGVRDHQPGVTDEADEPDETGESGEVDGPGPAGAGAAAPTPRRARPVDGRHRTRHAGHDRRRGRRLLALAAAAVVVLGVAAGALVLAGNDRSARTEVASATLTNAGLDPHGEGPRGTASLVRKGGATYLDLHLTDAPAPADGYLEVWLIAPDLEGMVSLGPFRGDGLYLVPAGIDPARFPIVDVSDEPPDGQPTHSGISLLRGDLA